MPPSALTDVLESRLSRLLPAELRAAARKDPSAANLTRALEHLRTLQHRLRQYLPRTLVEDPPTPGAVRHAWQEGTLLFADLAGYTSLLDAHVGQGPAGAEALRESLNDYFTTMLDIISRSGAVLLEFTGDAMLAAFAGGERGSETSRAVRAGLRMQRAMARFTTIQTRLGALSLQMRVGLHAGRYLAADVGTPRRMEHVLLGETVRQAKAAETAGRTGCVCLSVAAASHVEGEFRLQAGQPGHWFVVDDLTDDELGDYEVTTGARRLSAAVLWDRSPDDLAAEIERVLGALEPLAAFLPEAILSLLVESAAERRIAPSFLEPTVMFVNLIGLSQAVDRAGADELPELVAAFSRLFAQINEAVEGRSGVLKKVTCDHAGSDMVMYFGAPGLLSDDTRRAAEAALAIRGAVGEFAGPKVGGEPLASACQIGLARGWALAAEMGEARGRHEFNVLGDVANTAAHLKNRAAPNQILMTEPVYREIAGEFECEALPALKLKGKPAPVPVYALTGG